MKKKPHKRPVAALAPSSLDPASLFDRWYVAAGLMVAAVLLFFGRALFSDRMLFGTDFIAGAYMTRAYILAGIKNFGAAPLWYASLYGGVPLTSVGSIAGDYWYPLLWPLYHLALAPQQIALYGYCLHVLLGGLGTYLLLRNWRIAGAAAFIAGIAYMFTGSIVSLIYAGHDAKIIVSALLPWLLLFIGKTVETRKLLWALCGGVIIGLALMSPHVQMSYYLLLAGFSYAAGLIYVRFRRERRWRSVALAAGLGAVMLVIGFAIYAVQALTLQDYMKFSPRGEDKGYAYATSYSMPPEEILNTVWPEFSGLLDAGSDESPTRWYWGRRDLKIHTEYTGVIPALLALVGLLYSRRKKLKWFLTGLACFALVVAFGGFTPLYHLVYSLIPMMSKFRSPAMIFNTFAFALIALSALGVEALIHGDHHPKIATWLAAMVGGSLLLGIVFSAAKDGITGLLESFAAGGWGAQALWNSYPEMVKGFWLSFVLLAAGSLLVWLLAKRKLPLTWWSIAVALLVLLELWRVDSHFFKLVDPPDRFFAKDEIVSRLEQDTTLHRVWPLQVHQQGNYLTLFGIQTVGGEHPSPLKRYCEFVGISPKQAHPDFHNLIQHPQFLSLLNVKYLLMQGPLAHPDFTLWDSCYGGQVKIYRNTRALPRAWLAGGYEVIAQDDRILARMQRPDFNPGQTVILEREPAGFVAQPNVSGTAAIDTYQPNLVAVSVQTQSPALLVLSDNHYPAWHAYLDGKPTECYRADYTFRAVAVPAGKHVVEFRYESTVFRIGLMTSIITLIVVVCAIAALSYREYLQYRVLQRSATSA